MTKAAQIRKEMRRVLGEKDEFTKQDLLSSFPSHASLIGYVLHKAVEDGELVKIGTTRGAKYRAGSSRTIDGDVITKTYARDAQSEEDIFNELQDEFLTKYELSENTKHIISYSFTEMVNNAIDHSSSDEIEVKMWVDDGDLRFTVRDHGIGVFKHVMQGCGLKSERDALLELTKGKVTTAPMWHSGEGIFFTSRAADSFSISSGELTMLRTNNGESRLEITEGGRHIEGTLVGFSVSLKTDRHLARDVFGQFESEEGERDFGKTEVEVRLFDKGDVHVSRSQAKRLMAGLDKFKVVTLDFGGIPFIGQGFADQIFRIFVREHPDTRLIVKDAAPDVQFMIERVRKDGA